MKPVISAELKGLQNCEVLFNGRSPRLSKAGWLRAAQTGRLVKSRSVLIDFREALLYRLVRYASICKEAPRLYQPPRQRYALPLLLRKEESF